MDLQAMERSGKEDINFLTVSQSFAERSDLGNGVNLLPEELITKIFDFMEPNELIKLSEVCQKWNVIVKQPYLWRKKYQRKYKKQPKRYEWYILYPMVTTDYFECSPICVGGARFRFEYWPGNNQTSHLIPPVEGFNVTTVKGDAPLNLRTISRCISNTKVYINTPEIMNFGNNKLVTSIVNAFKPVVYTVEWVRLAVITHRCNYRKMTKIMSSERLAEYCTKQAIESALHKKFTSNWKKKPIFITEYALVNNISFVHMISINQPIRERLGNNSIEEIEKKPKIYSSSLPLKM